MINEEKEPRSLYNPSLEDVETDVDKNGPNPEHYVLKAGAIKEFPNHVADLLEDKLVEKMLWKNPPGNKNNEKKREELRRIINV